MGDYAGNNPYPYGSGFAASQYSNPYSLYYGQALPWPSQYGGTPTNALGQPIASYQQAQQAAQQAPQGTTLNSSPAQPKGYASGMPILQGTPGASNAAANSNPMMAQLAGWQAMNNPEQASGGNVFGDPYLNAISGGGQQQQAPPQQAAAPFNSRAAALQALANPGPVTTPGANVPYNQGPVSQGPGVLQQFLQNWQQRGSPTTGAGNYNNAGFYNALQNMQGAK